MSDAKRRLPRAERSRDAEPPGRRRTLVSRFDPRTWSGALAIMVGFAAVLWIVEAVNAANDQSLDRFGLRPRTIGGLDGILTMPFLHAGVAHLAANTAPFMIVGWLVLVGGGRNFIAATAIVVVGGGILTWLIGPSSVIVGASALVFGWLGYLVARAYFSRRILWIIAAAFALFFFGGLFNGLLPSVHHQVAWQAHVSGFVAGVVAGWVLHPRKGSTRGPGRLRSPRTSRRPRDPGAASV